MINSKRLRQVLLIATLVGVLLVSVAGTAFAQAAGVIPGSSPAGGDVTIIGSGFQPGEQVTVEIGGSTIASGFADDSGEFTLSGTIPSDIPPGSHPMDVNGDQGTSLDFEYQVDPTQETTTTTTTAAPTTTTAAPTTTQAATTTEASTTTAAPPSTDSPATTDSPTTIVEDDSRIYTSTGGDFPWILLILVMGSVLLGGGLWWWWRTTTAPEGAFTDDQGNQWTYCSARSCKLDKNSSTGTDGRRVDIRALARKENCPDCSCVLFEIPKDGGSPILLDEDGGWVSYSGKVSYSARCVKRA